MELKDYSTEELKAELKNEDEMIRQAILSYFTKCWGNCKDDVCGIHVEDVIAWLEKQVSIDENEVANHVDKVEPKFKVGDKIRIKTPSSFDKDMEVARIEKDYYLCNHIGKFSSEVVPFSKESSYELIEQKPANKVEPKFHEDEWITNGDYTWKIVEVKPLDYILQSQDGNIVDDTISHIDEQFHSFTLKDAKDGDVLVSVSNQPFIYNGECNTFYVGAYCGMNCIGEKFIISQKKCHWTARTGIKPATKEQRDFLFQKMKEAGYEWSDKDRKLIKIIK